MGGETNLHKYLKCLGISYLNQLNCRLIATEIYVRKSASDDWLNGDKDLAEKVERYSKYGEIEHHLKKENNLDSKWIIDILGIGEVNIMEPNPKYDNRLYQPMQKIGTETLIRGIEVKVSRNDFNNGYVQSGLNLHYLLCPELLVKKSEIPKHVGLLYWPDGSAKYIYCAKRPMRMKLNKDMFDYYRDSIYQRYHSLIMGMTNDQITALSQSIEKQKERT